MLVTTDLGKKMGEVTITEGGKTKRYPAYVCAHCNRVIVLNPNRTRDRKHCLKCGGYICEKTELCREVCTPINELARDHFARSAHGQYAPAILSGAKTFEEAHELGQKEKKHGEV